MSRSQTVRSRPNSSIASRSTSVTSLDSQISQLGAVLWKWSICSTLCTGWSVLRRPQYHHLLSSYQLHHVYLNPLLIKPIVLCTLYCGSRSSSSESLEVFTVRRSLHGLIYSYRNSVRPSVCPSVCHTRGLCPHGSTYNHDFFTVW